MIDLDTCLRGMFDAQDKLRSDRGVNSPEFMSEQMMRLSQYTGSVEEHLAGYEKELETTYAVQLKQYMITEGMKVTQAERMVDMDLAETKGQVKYLTRLTKSAWSQIGVIQSRINHLVREAQTGSPV